jgi:vacuolar-type H+-ATPase subunit C/Vma6
LRAAGLGSWLGAAAALRQHGYPVAAAETQVTPDAFDREAGRLVADRLQLLGRWLGSRRPALAVVYEEEDRRTLRVLLRGAAQGVSPIARLRGVVPTPSLPDRILERLARVESPADLARILIRAGHPAGRALLAVRPPTGRRPLLHRLEAALARLFVTRATRAARGAGRVIGEFVALHVDVENAWTLLAAGTEAPVPSDSYLPGGGIIDQARFARVAALGNASSVRDALARLFRRTPLEHVFEIDQDESGFERRVLRATVAWLRRAARHDPLGPAVVLGVVQRIRAEAHDVRLVLSAASLGAPESAVEPVLATAA